MDSGHQTALETGLTSLAQNLASSMGYELILVEVRGGGNHSVVRVFIDQPGGITLNDCERFSKRLGVALDVEDIIPFSYVLEVSSPGLDRPLIKEADFLRFAGKIAKIRTRPIVGGQKSHKGKILGVTEGRLSLEVSPGKQVEIAMTDIEKANLVIEI